jgi:nicotinamidase/pyrazinamidase
MAKNIEPSMSALLVVDLQPDFMPGGALAVEEGDKIIAPIAELMRTGWFQVVVATQDWHPSDHVSFASQHEGRDPMDVIELNGHPQTLWPDHCVQETPGAELHRDVPSAPIDAIVRKGSDRETDSYSGFRNNWNPVGERPPTGLAGYLRERGIGDVYVCGLARDVCAKWTAEDAADLGFRTRFLWDLTRSVDPESNGQVRTDLEEAGVEIMDSADLSQAS